MTEISDEHVTLLVRHLPSALSAEEREDLLKHFGATSVSCMPDKGKLKYTAFARFPDASKAKEAIQRLHQLEVLGSKLVVEYSKEQHKKYHPPLLKELDVKAGSVEETKVVTEAVDLNKSSAENVNSLSSKWGLIYPSNPRLHYAYPPPNVTILTNIANALASVPKFYVQVLHLMNKMCLPPPFGAVTSTPPLAETKPAQYSVDKRDQATNTQEQDSVDIESDESEIMSDDEERPVQLDNIPVKRQLHQSKQPKKKPKLQQLIQAPLLGQVAASHTLQTPDEVFEVTKSSSDITVTKPIEFRLRGEVSAMQQQVEEMQTEPSEAEQPPLPPGPPPEVGGFGKLEPVARSTAEEQEENEDEQFGDGEFISSSQLRKGRLSSSQLKDFNVFKSYSPGEPSSRLYIKNLAKQSTEKDLHYIFGRYVNWENEKEKLMFDIRLMKEGRMKGQAFITLPDETVAKKAVKDTNAFVLNNKPMAVQFARSAKPKEQ